MENQVARAFQIVRDATYLNDMLSVAEKIAVLELIKHELLKDSYAEIVKRTMNEDQ